MNKVKIINKCDNLQSIVDCCMKLRENSFWSFRGQRKKEWDVKLHHGKDVKSIMISFNNFKDRCKEFSQPNYIKEHDDWRWLFYAQHYGLKTPLIDWTSNPLIAIYFAVENIISKCNDDKHYGAIWAIKVNPETRFSWDSDLITQPKDMTDWKMIKPPPITNRIIRQSSLFTFHPNEEIFSINEYSEKEFIKIEIPKIKGKNINKRIRQELGIMNIHHASLFPEPSGVANFINFEFPDLHPSQIEKIMPST
jgi:hypothetical protein